MTKRAKVSEAELRKDPNILWNEFIHILASEDKSELSELQMHAYRCWWYDSQVLNGGHLQFFENEGLAFAKEVLPSLDVLGLPEQRTILSKAIVREESLNRAPVATADEFVAQALGEPFKEFDDAYNARYGEVQRALEKHLEENRSLYIELVQAPARFRLSNLASFYRRN